MTYKQTVEYLYEQLPMYQRIGSSAYNKDLTRTQKLLGLLGSPEKGLACIHIAGTNGKGSTAHLIASVYQRAGYKVGLHTSPHLLSFTERIKLNGETISEEYVIDFVENIKEVIEDIGPSFFELTVAMALKYFADQKVDLAIVEVGLGGRLDSTNVITPKVSIITSIGLDHQKFLGDTIGEIAIEKAGIIKEGIPVVAGDIQKEGLDEIVKIARQRKAHCYIAQDYYTVREGNQLAVLHIDKSIWNNLESDLHGDALSKNLPIVLQTVELLQEQYPVALSKARKGIESVCSTTGLLGRWQILQNEPLTVCDVGHNEEAIRQLVNRIQSANKQKVHVIWGMVEDKAVSDVINLLPYNWSYYFCAPDIDRAMPVDGLQKMARSEGLTGDVFASVKSAYEAARQQANREDLVFIGGSTFVVAEVLA